MKKIFHLCLLLFFSIPLHCLTITVAALYFYQFEQSAAALQQTNFQAELIRELETVFPGTKLNFVTLAEDGNAPKSFLDAVQLCNTHKIEYLLYGYIEKKEFTVYGELKLLDGQRREIIQVFYSMDNQNRQERLLKDLAGKTAAYFSSLFAPEAANVKQAAPEEGIFSLLLAGGYWPVLAEEWDPFLLPLYTAELALGFIPRRPVFADKPGPYYYKTGLTCTFLHSKNKSGYEDFNLYCFTFGILNQICIDYGQRHTLALALVPQFLIDYLILERLHAETIRIPGYSFALTGDFSYRCHFSNYVTGGVSHKLTVHFTEPLRLLYNPSLLWEFSLRPLAGGMSNG